MPKAIDLTGQQFGRLQVLQLAEHRYSKSGTSKRYWLCKCVCGKECVVNSASLRSGNVKSCGCLKREKDKVKRNHLTHGMSKTRLYTIWIDMKRRCDDSWRKSYKYYGGKGISYCDEWKDFNSFYIWATNNGYEENLTLDRKNVEKNYSPNNCRWVDWKTQANNRTNNRRFQFKGESKTLAELAKEHHISYKILNDRINKLGWGLEEALLTPKYHKKED